MECAIDVTCRLTCKNKSILYIKEMTIQNAFKSMNTSLKGTKDGIFEYTDGHYTMKEVQTVMTLAQNVFEPPENLSKEQLATMHTMLHAYGRHHVKNLAYIDMTGKMIFAMGLVLLLAGKAYNLFKP
jgi:hypothetical protein